jgi:hypothetical protein
MAGQFLQGLASLCLGYAAHLHCSSIESFWAAAVTAVALYAAWLVTVVVVTAQEFAVAVAAAYAPAHVCLVHDLL